MRRTSVHPKFVVWSALARCALAAAVSLLAAGAARADIAITLTQDKPVSLLASPYEPAASDQANAAQASAVDIVCTVVPLRSPIGGALADLPACLADYPNDLPSSAPAAHSLPPPPNGFSIALSGLATVGAMRLLRQAKNIHLGVVPEWYHLDAPDRIGNAVRLDLGTNPSLVPICWYEPIVIPEVVQGLCCHDCQPNDQSCWQAVYFIPTIVPRSPPAVA